MLEVVLQKGSCKGERSSRRGKEKKKARQDKLSAVLLQERRSTCLGDGHLKGGGGRDNLELILTDVSWDQWKQAWQETLKGTIRGTDLQDPESRDGGMLTQGFQRSTTGDKNKRKGGGGQERGGIKNENSLRTLRTLGYHRQ